VSAVVEIRTLVVFGYEEIVSPAQDFFDGGDEIFLLRCKVSERIGDVFDVWGRGGRGAEEIRCGNLGREETFMEGGEGFKGKTEPSSAVVSPVRGVERSGEEFSKSVQASDASPGQLRVRDIIIGERFANID
jgi:hypothetical protein